ncbi:MAG: SDR family NAD(P)-dependent oxidoreductase [Deltaproteobacteria bacterium]
MDTGAGLHLTKMMHEVVREDPSRPRLIDATSGRAISGDALYQTSARFASLLVQRGLAVGSRVLTLLPDGVDLVAVYAGIWQAGGVLVPQHPNTPAAQLTEMFRLVAPRVVVTSPEGAERVRAAAEDAHFEIIVLTPPDATPAHPTPDERTPVLGDFFALIEDERPLETYHGGGDLLAIIGFTSGSTGTPKGVVHAHDSLGAAQYYLRDRKPVRTVWGFPLDSVGGTSLLLSQLHTGYTICFPKSLNPVDILDAIQGHRCNVIFTGPTVLSAIIAFRDVDRYDLSTMHRWEYAGGPLGDQLARELVSGKLPGRLHCTYGLSELVILTRTIDSEPLKIGSIGRPYGEGTAVRIVKTDGTEAGVDEVGELLAQGPSLFRGYYQRPDETAEIIQNNWLHSGDLVRRDADGDIFIVGRIKDLIIRGGKNVVPSDVEAVVRRHPAVLDVAVVGVENELLGEEVVAFTVLRPETEDAEKTVAEIDALCEADLHPGQRPRVRLLDELPSNDRNKVDKFALKRLGRDGFDAGEETELTATIRKAPAKTQLGLVTREVRQLIAEHLEEPESSIREEALLTELGMESRHAVELSQHLGARFGLRVNATFVFNHPTVHAISTELTERITSSARVKKAAKQTEGLDDDPVVVVGLGVRLPGGIENEDDFWLALQTASDLRSPFPEDRYDVAALTAPESANVATRGGFIDDIQEFDAGLFRISPIEAAAMDPNQRLLLETCWAALENAGIAPERLAGTRSGALFGIGNPDFLMDFLPSPAFAGGIGGMHSVAVGRISFVLGLRGLSFALDTACSSGLVACHLAARAIRSGDLDLALVGGVNVALSDLPWLNLSAMGALSPTSQCHTFDASADGYARGEGCGVLVLMRRSKAIRDGHTIRAVVSGSAVNHDGFSTAITAPNGTAQQELIVEALTDAGLEPSDVGYVEAHGTGTPLGDPIEIAAITKVLAGHYRQTEPLRITSVKTNIGHLEMAAGAIGLIRIVLSVERAEITPNVGLTQLNPHIEAANAAVTFPVRSIPWTAPRRVAGVSSFGFSGTNGHVIVESTPEELIERSDVRSPWETCFVPISAPTDSGLRALAGRLGEHLETHPSTRLPDFMFTIGAGRSHGFRHRAAIRAKDREELTHALATLADGEEHKTVLRGHGPGQRPGKVALMFTGQGAQYVSMGRELYAKNAVFRRALDACQEAGRPFLDRPLLDVMHGEGDGPIAETEWTQPTAFAVSYALAELWRSVGVEPEAVIGHSIGEYVAACRADVMDLESAMRLVAARGQLMQRLPAGGAMASISDAPDVVAQTIRDTNSAAVIAGYNGPRSTVVSGPEAAVDALVEALTSRSVKATKLKVSHAFHSPLMEPMLDAFREVADQVRFRPASIPVASNVTGRLYETGWAPDAKYWVDHIRSAVRFQPGLEALYADGARIFVEAGPHPVLLGLGRSFIEDAACVWSPSLRRSAGEERTFLQSAAELYAAGVELDFEQLLAGDGVRRIPLPSYPFERKYYWPKVDAKAASSGGRPIQHPLVVEASDAPPLGMRCRIDLASEHTAYLEDHQVHDVPVFPATGYVEAAIAAVGAVFESDVRQLEDVELMHPLRIADDKEVYVIVSTESADRPAFSVVSGVKADRKQWTTHCRGVAVLTPPNEPERARLSRLREPMVHDVDPDALYGFLDAMGLDYQAAFQNVTELGRAADGRQSLGRVKLSQSEAVDAKDYAVHPALLDAALHCLATPTDEASPDAEMPVRIDRLVVHRGGEREAWVHTQRRDDDAMNVTLIDPDGEIIAELTGLHTATVSRALLEKMVGAEKPEMIYAPTWQETQAGESKDRRWIVIGDAAYANELGAKAVSVDDGFAALDAALEDVDGVLDLRALGLTDADAPPPSVLAANVARLELVKHLLERNEKLHLVLATRGATRIESGERVLPLQAALLGQARTMIGEAVGVAVSAIDLEDAELSPAQAVEQLRRALTVTEPEVACRQDRLYVPRVDKWTKQRALTIPEGESFELVTRAAGILENLELVERERRAPKDDEVELEVTAVGLNFRDVMNAMGAYPGGVEPIGSECAGVVTAVGSAVKSVKVGDAIVCLVADGAFRRYAIAQETFVAPVRAPVALTGAVTLPITMMTALHGLETLADLKPGEVALIHAGAGGVGLAAIQLALRTKAKIIATAGSPRKRDYLRRLGVEHVFDSRSLSFADDVRALVGERGVDLVLNSLAGEFIDASLALLREGGRFVEIGKVRVLKPDEVPAGVRYFHFDTGLECLEKPGLFAEMWATIESRIAEGSVRPLAHETYRLEATVDAFRTMARGAHVGKNVIVVDPDYEVGPREDGTYLVTGGTGALGLTCAAWLLERGAGHVVLMSRRGVTPETEAAVRDLDPDGRRVSVVRGDTSSADDVTQLVAGIEKRHPPLRGVLHAAGLLRDGMAASQDEGTFAAVFAPKVDGTFHLGRATESCDLDFFVVFSSIAARFGNPGQSNYAAANAYMDGWVAQAREAGRAAQTIAWGPWGEIGMAADEAALRGLTAAGLVPIAPADGVAALAQLIRGGREASVVLGVDWSKFVDGPLGALPVWSKLTATRQKKTSARAKDGALDAARAASGEARQAAVVDFLRDQVRSLLGAEDDYTIDEAAELRDVGVDSLMATELRNRLSTAVGASLPGAAMMEHPTLGGLAGYLGGMLGEGHSEEPRSQAPQPEAPTATAALQVDIVDLTAPAAPLFCFPPAGADAAVFTPLAARLKPWRIAVVEAATSASNEAPTSLDALVAAAIGAVRAVQPRGPYRLFGHSFGGMIAQEVAAALERDGDEVAFLWKLEAPVSFSDDPLREVGQARATSGFAQRVGVAAADLDGVFREMGAFAVAFDAMVFDRLTTMSPETFQRMFPRVRDLEGDDFTRELARWTHEEGWLPAALSPDVCVDRVRKVRQTLAWVAGYRPSSVNARQVTGRATVGAPFGTGDWSDYATGAFEQIDVEGDHISCVMSPGIDAVARSLDALLREAGV